MKITVEVDQNIMKNESPDMLKIIIEQDANGLDEWLDIFKRILQAMTFEINGNLEVVDEEE